MPTQAESAPDVTGAAAVLERVQTPEGELALRRRPGSDGAPVFEIILDGVFLMSSEDPASERLLARVALAALSPLPPSPRVLVGGLGMGFTLRAALDLLPPAAVVRVAELHEPVRRWCEGPLAKLNGGALRDARVRVVPGDVGALLAAAAACFDAVLLDVDNGPGWLVREENRVLYGPEGLGRLHAALAPGGVVAIWAAAPEPGFGASLAWVFARVEEHRVEKPRGPADVVYVGKATPPRES